MGIGHWLTEHIWMIIWIAQGVVLLWVLVSERKEPDAAIAWAFVVTLLPVLGLLLYVLVRHIASLRHVRRRKRFSVDEGIQQALRAAASAVRRAADCPWETARLIRHQNDNPCTGDNRLEILVDAQAKYARLFEDIRAAQHSVHLSYFIYEKDGTGTRLRDLLVHKAREGVEVRLLYDRLGSIFTPRRFFRPIEEAGGAVRRYMPTAWGNLLRIDNRHHRKTVVIDDRVAYTGGINIGDEYLGAKPKTAPWRDTQIRVYGSEAAAVQQRFFVDWAFCGGEVPDALERYFPRVSSGGTALAQFVSSGPERPKEEVKFAYMKLVGEARRALYVQTPYFAPDESFLQALYLASATGVDVRVMLPGKPDKWSTYWVTLSHVEDLLRRGIRVYLYPGFLHAKMLVADGEVASIGTANIDMRSFSLDYEDCVFCYDEDFAGVCAGVFLADAGMCRELTLEAFGKRSGWEKGSETVWRVLRALM